MKIDEDAIRAGAVAMGRAGANQFDLHTRMAMARAAVTAYLAALPALPAAEPGRDRIAVSRFACGMVMARVLEGDEEPDFDEMESVIDMEYGRAARYIVRARCPPPAELVPVEVEGSVEGVGP